MPSDRPPPILPEVTVVIPTLGRAILAEALAALSRGTRWPTEILVVDQSPDADAERLVRDACESGLSVRHIRSSGRGRAVGVNEGIREVRTCMILLTDDDCIAEPEWVEVMAQALDRHPRAIVTGRIEAWEGGGVPVVATSRTGFIQRRPRPTHDSLSGGNMGAAREVLEHLGLLDEDPRSATAEDVEFAYRALRAGTPLVYEPASGVAHADWREGEARAEQYRSYALSHGAFYGKYLRRGHPLIAVRILVHMLRAGRRWLTGLVRRDPDRALNGRSYFLFLPRGIVAGWRSPAGVVSPGKGGPTDAGAGTTAPSAGGTPGSRGKSGDAP